LIEGGPAALSFVAITCADLDRSRAFYRTLGFREVAQYPSENPDGSHLRIDGPVAMDEIVLAAPDGGDVLVMLVGFRTPRAEPSAARAANTLGMWRVAFLVADIEAAAAELERHGIATISAPVTLAMGAGLPNLRFVCFRGPDAEVVEIIEQPTS
jgi:catechol 2,3-dioxygenase-like lactoylglutathione lyase family enzyme